jgi:hypothetical protein
MIYYDLIIPDIWRIWKLTCDNVSILAIITQ